jgi:hypothetical protein
VHTDQAEAHYRENQIIVSNQNPQQPTHRKGMATMTGGKDRHTSHH